MERSHYSDKNRKNSTLLTFAVSHLFSLWSIWVFGFQLINLSACAFSVHLPLSDHFISLSTFFFHLLVFCSLLFSLFSLFTSFPACYPFQMLSISFSPLLLWCTPLPSYLSLTGGEDLEGLNLFLLTVPGHCLWVQDTGYHRVLLHLWRKKNQDKIIKHKWKFEGTIIRSKRAKRQNHFIFQDHRIVLK